MSERAWFNRERYAIVFWTTLGHNILRKLSLRNHCKVNCLVITFDRITERPGSASSFLQFTKLSKLRAKRFETIFEDFVRNGQTSHQFPSVNQPKNIPEQGRIQDLFRRGCTRLLLYFNTNKPHSFFFLQNTSCIRKPQVISGRGGVRTPCTLPLDPPQLNKRQRSTERPLQISPFLQFDKTFRKPIKLRENILKWLSSEWLTSWLCFKFFFRLLLCPHMKKEQNW